MWEFIKVELPQPKRTGRPRSDDRKLLNGIMFVLRTGCRWSDMPSEYGNGKTANRRFLELKELGVWEKINKKLLEKHHKKLIVKKKFQ